MQQSASIQIRNLTKRYGAVLAIDDVSLDVKAGEFLTLLGLSGSGKSTTLMAVAGFVDPDQGNIAISGSDVTALSPEKRNLGVVFQNYALFPHMNVYDNIAFPLRMRRRPAAEIDKAVKQVLDLVSLGHLDQRRTTELSGGQQQRVALARALIFAPPVLLMDEPLGALDRQLREQLQIEIGRIHKQLGVTVLYVTHDQDEALSMSDRIAVMAHGRVQQLGTPSDIYMKPQSRFVAGFFGESNFFDVTAEPVGDMSRLAPKGISGAVLYAAGQRPLSGANFLAMVRPEAVEICDGPDATFENNLAGVIERQEFFGSSMRVSVRSGACTILVRTSRLATTASLQPGAAVWLRWRANETALFEADT